MRVLVTGGAGFIGSALIRHLIANTGATVLNVDKLTYASSQEALGPVSADPRYQFEQADVTDGPRMAALLRAFRPQAIMHLAAESHVDRSIDGPAAFIQSNVLGTYTLLEAARQYWLGLGRSERESFRFHQVSTDEVYGSLGEEGAFTEASPYRPSSPYSASKAAADHLARAWYETYGLPVLVSNCSNNYGPYQFPDKLIPLMIQRGLAGEPLPVYGTGAHVRDWLYVTDHAEALWQVLTRGQPGETYNIGGHNERTNLEVVRAICRLLDEQRPRSGPHESLIAFVADRPGHDRRYAIDPTKIERALGWRPAESFDSGLRKTVEWYLQNPGWVERATAGEYEGQRLGVAGSEA